MKKNIPPRNYGMDFRFSGNNGNIVGNLKHLIQGICIANIPIRWELNITPESLWLERLDLKLIATKICLAFLRSQMVYK